MELESPRVRGLVSAVGTGPTALDGPSGVTRRGGPATMLLSFALGWSPHGLRDVWERMGSKVTTSRARCLFIGGGQLADLPTRKTEARNRPDKNNRTYNKLPNPTQPNPTQPNPTQPSPKKQSIRNLAACRLRKSLEWYLYVFV
jgi:hypothetical protein